METSTIQQVNFKENSVVKFVMRYELKGKPKTRKDLIAFFRVISWEEITASEFTEQFVNVWLNRLAGIQSSECKWKYIKYKEVKKRVYSTFPLQLQGELSEYTTNDRLRFQFLLTCNSHSYPFTLHYTPAELGAFDDYIFNVHMPEDEPFQFHSKVSLVEKSLVHPFSFPESKCRLLFVKKLGRGKGKNISYKEVEYVAGDSLLTGPTSVKRPKPIQKEPPLPLKQPKTKKKEPV